MAKHPSLFPEPSPVPDIPGLQYIDEYITPDQERRLITAIDRREWLTHLKRRVQHYGYTYEYKGSGKTLTAAPPLPRWAHGLIEKLLRDELTDEKPNQLIINEYEPGQGISPHIDDQTLFGDVVISISLLSACLMDFTRSARKKLSLLLEPRSAVVLSGDSRHKWEHSIAPRKMDIIEGERMKRGRRISLTFRTVKFEE